MNFDIPSGLTELLQEFTVTVLRSRPTGDLYQFAADYFSQAVDGRRHVSKSEPKAEMDRPCVPMITTTLSHQESSDDEIAGGHIGDFIWRLYPSSMRLYWLIGTSHWCMAGQATVAHRSFNCRGHRYWSLRWMLAETFHFITPGPRSLIHHRSWYTGNKTILFNNLSVTSNWTHYHCYVNRFLC